MNTAVKLSAYGVALALVAVGGWAAGSAVGPLSVQAGTHPAETHPADTRQGEDAEHGDTHGGAVAGAPDQPGGLTMSDGGYTLTPTATTAQAGPAQTYTFQIVGPDGHHPVTRFDVAHEKLLHLIVVRRDTVGYQHVHPEMAPDGTWTATLDLSRPGSYRVFADFTPTGGGARKLGVDLTVAGEFQPVEHPVSRTAEVDGYQVRLDGALVPGKSSKVTAAVSKDGKPVTDLQPYLGAYGHLVALRGGDLAYLHVHAGEGTAPGPVVTFVTEVPSAGRYRLFLDFRHGGVVRTAEFTVDATGGH